MFELLIFMSILNAEVAIGFKGGVNFVKVRGTHFDIVMDGEYKIANKTGYNFGVPIEVNILDFFSIQPEIFFSTRGMKGEYEEPGYKETLVQNLTYIDIPILLKFILPQKRFQPNIYVGPVGSFRIATNGEFEEEEDGDVEIYKFDNGDKEYIRKHTKPVDFGVAFGGGLAINAGPGKIELDLRYTLGLVNIVRLTDFEKIYWGNNGPNLKYGAFSILMGYTFIINN